MPLSNPEEFQAWRDSPLTKEFLNLLVENHLSMTLAWGRGRLMTEREQEKATVLGSLARLRFSRADCEDNETSIEELMGKDWSEEKVDA